MLRYVFFIAFMFVTMSISSFAVISASYSGSKSVDSVDDVIEIGARYETAQIHCTPEACVLVCNKKDPIGGWECSFGSADIVWCQGCIESELFVKADGSELEEFAEKEVENGNLGGIKHLNIVKDGVKYYRSVEWYADLETNTFEFTISITEDEE